MVLAAPVLVACFSRLANIAKDLRRPCPGNEVRLESVELVQTASWSQQAARVPTLRQGTDTANEGEFKDWTEEQCGKRCAGPTCAQGAYKAGEDGLPVCPRDGAKCRVLPQGCETCPKPIFEVTQVGLDKYEDASTDLSLEAGTSVYGFEEAGGFTVNIRREEGSICNLLCWVFEVTTQSGITARDELPEYPISCGQSSGTEGGADPSEPCGNTQNACVDLAVAKQFDIPRLYESALISARLYNLQQRTSSKKAGIYFINKADLVKDVLCGDGYAMNRLHNTSIIDIEGCDDGNLVLYDGCDEHCNIEPGWTCTPNTSNPAISNCTGGSPPEPKAVDMAEVLVNFGTPVLVALFLACCCVAIKYTNPDVLKKAMPFGIHEKVALIGLGIQVETDNDLYWCMLGNLLGPHRPRCSGTLRDARGCDRMRE